MNIIFKSVASVAERHSSPSTIENLNCLDHVAEMCKERAARIENLSFSVSLPQVLHACSARKSSALEVEEAV
jgi:hypothetical protein